MGAILGGQGPKKLFLQLCDARNQPQQGLFA
jgi:hypothetical protein